MYELYFGTDLGAVRQKALARISLLKEAGATITHIEGGSSA